MEESLPKLVLNDDSVKDPGQLNSPSVVTREQNPIINNSLVTSM